MDRTWLALVAETNLVSRLIANIADNLTRWVSSPRKASNMYEALCQKHGVAWDEDSPRFVNETLESITEKYQKDEYLNNVPLRYWDDLAISFLAYNRRSGLSLSQVVCMQKHAARRLIEERLKSC